MTREYLLPNSLPWWSVVIIDRICIWGRSHWSNLLLLLHLVIRKHWIDLKAAHWQLSTHGFGKKGPLSPPPLPCLSWQYLHRPFIPVFTCDKDRWVTVKMWQKLCAAVAMRTLRLLLVTLTLLVLESQGFELQDTIHALIEENIHLHDQLENLTKALRELKRMLWLHSNGTESSLCYL